MFIPELDPRFWFDGISDFWLIDRMVQYMNHKTSWSTAVAVGMYGRLRLDTPERKRMIVQSLLNGQMDPIEARAWEWIRGRDLDQIQWLKELAIAEVGSLFVLIENLEEDDSYSLHNLNCIREHLAIHRDDLACVLRLIYEVDPEFELALLDEVDRRGALLPKDQHRYSYQPERWERVRDLDHDAWWPLV